MRESRHAHLIGEPIDEGSPWPLLICCIVSALLFGASVGVFFWSISGG